MGSYTSIALDASGKAHISYYDYTNGDLKYATNASGSWVVETACDRFLGCGSYSSIALDPDGILYISNYGEDGTLLLTISCIDEDGDGYGAPGSSHCPEPELDCDDSDPEVNPGAAEGPHGDPICSDKIDNDCDGDVDGDDTGCQAECADNDGDGYGDPASPACAHPQRDCNDSNPNVNPGHAEVPGNGLDDDCDGAVNESCFVATAAFGSELEPRIEVLRTFRDRYLMTNPLGEAFVTAYYKCTGVRQRIT